MKRNWESLFEEVTGLPADGESIGPILSGCDGLALASKLIGDETIHEAVDYIVLGGAAWGLVDHFLSALTPAAAVTRCEEWLQEPGSSIDQRRIAASILSRLPRAEAVALVDKLLTHADPLIARYGAELFYALATRVLLSKEASDRYLKMVLESPHEDVREFGSDIEPLVRGGCFRP